ncbi:histone-fold-containing protein [Myriangium duriaei CBS 260.36]|uniref:DNA polymerase epsilon subunit D n=1 Tax=Myriangium duriaei CBS 260.36 TaxID=1168546 RepID=A0A9P4J970_9PEZI|nr:histone-fold-containing protein [Myriangium duriaei CBS 260.36]
MPPRKSNVSTTTNGDGDTSTISTIPKSRESISVEDLNLPRTMIQRLSKGVLPSNTQIQRDALLALSKSATVFVNFLAASASENALASGKKTIMPHDVFAALKDQEFEALVPRVQAEMAKYNEIQSDKRNTYRRSKKAEQVAAAAAAGGDGDDAMDELAMGDEIVANVGTNGADAEEAERPSKKVRREDGDEVASDGVEEDEEEIVEEEEEESGEEDEVEEEEEVEEDEEDEADEDEEGESSLNGIRDEALDEPDSD